MCRLWFQSALPVAVSSQISPLTSAMFVPFVVRGTLGGPPSLHPGLGQGLGEAARALVKAAAEDSVRAQQGMPGVAVHSGSKSALGTRSGLQQPGGVSAAWLEMVLLLFNCFGLIRGKKTQTNQPPAPRLKPEV